jgi:membrane dipeptidase
MSRYLETDPLLSQNGPSPEVTGLGNTGKTQRYGSQVPQSDTGGYYSNEDAAEDADEPPQDSVSRAGANVVGILMVLAMLFITAMLLPPGFFDPGEKPTPHHPLPVPPHRGDHSIDDRVSRILAGTPLFDGHVDLAIFIRAAYKNKIHTQAFKDKFEKGDLELNVDLPRLHEGKLGGAFWSAFVVCPEDASTDFSDSQYAESVSHTLSQIDLLRRLQIQYPDEFSPADAPLDRALELFHREGRFLAPISIEGLHQVPQTAPLSTLRLYHALGVRAATLTWNCHNAFADAALIMHNGSTTVAPYHRGGLTPAGRQVVREMNRLGILVDISHTSYWTQKAVLSNGTSAAPVIFSHSSAFSLCPHPRNVQDDILELVKDTKSLVMVNFSPGFISCNETSSPLELPEFYGKNNTLHQVARHIVYIGEKIGYPDLVAELLRMGVSDTDASKITGGNLLRVWREAEVVSQRLQTEIDEGEDEVHGY